MVKDYIKYVGIINLLGFFFNFLGFLILGVFLSNYLPEAFKVGRLYNILILSFCSSYVIFFIMEKYNIIFPHILKIILVVYYIFHYRQINELLKKINKNILIVNFLSLILSVFYFFYNDVPYIRGWDAANHLLDFIADLAMMQNPSLNLVAISSFYPNAFSNSSSLLAMGTNLTPMIIFKFNCALVLFTMCMAIYSYSRTRFSETEALYSIVSFNVTGYFLLHRGNYPFMISLACIAILLQFHNYLMNNSIKLRHIFLYGFILYGAFSFHPSPVMYFCIISGALFLNETLRRGKEFLLIRAQRYLLVFVVTIFFILSNLGLIFNQVWFLENYINVNYQTDVTVFFRQYIKEYYLIVIPILLVFPLLTGLYTVFKEKRAITEISIIIFVSLVYTFVKVFPPHNAREIYYMFYPLHALAGVGIARLSENLTNIFATHIKPNQNNILLLLKAGIPILILSNSLLSYYHFSFMDLRLQPEFLDEKDSEAVESLKDLSLPMIVTLKSPASELFYIRGVPGITFANRFETASELERELYRLFELSTGVKDFNRIIIENNVTSILLESRYTSPTKRDHIIQKIQYPYTITRMGRFSVVIIDLGGEK